MNADAVLLITPWYGKEHPGGVAVSVGNLVQGLRENGWEVVVLLPTGDGWIPRQTVGEFGETVIRLPLRAAALADDNLKSRAGSRLRIALARRTFEKLNRSKNFRFAHFHFCLESFEVLQQFCETVGLRYLVTFHGSEITQLLRSPRMKETIRTLVHGAVAITAVSEFLISSLREEAPDLEFDSTVIPNSCSPQFWDKRLEGVPSAEADKDIDVLYVGGLIPVKGPDVLLEAVKRVRLKRVDLQTVLVGAGSLKPALTSFCKDNGVSESVKFLGTVEHEELCELYRRARMVAIPSRSEGHSLVSVEAFLLGVPVVASNVGGLAENIKDGETGVLVPPDDPGSLADSIVRLLEEPSVAEALARNAREHAVTLFSPKQGVNRYVDVYRKMNPR